MRKLRCLLVIVFAGISVSPYFFTSNRFHKEAVAMSGSQLDSQRVQIPMPFEFIDSWNLPEVIPLTDEQRVYIIDILSALIRVVEGVSSLEQEEKQVLGIGQFHWPKNPDEPVRLSKSYFGENFRVSGIAARISRENESSPWLKAGVSIYPRNFPRSVYSMQLPAQVFKDFELVIVEHEQRSEQRLAKPAVFYLRHKRMENLQIKVEVRDDMVTAKDSYPRSFHYFEVSRRP